jgi:hypothetical protein
MMKRWMIMSMIAFGFLFMASCTPSNRVMRGGGGYGYYDPMYYGPAGYYYNPGMYPRTNVIIQQNRQQPRKRIVAPRSNRRPATSAPQNQRGNSNNRSTVQPRTQQQNAPSQINRRATTPGRRSTVAPSRSSSPAPAQRSAPSRSRRSN